METKNKFDCIITIVNRGFSDYVIETAKANGASGATVLNARGSGVHEQESFFGVNIHPEKEMVLILTLKDQTKKLMQQIVEQASLNLPGKGICFSVPVNQIAGVSHLFQNK